MPKIGYKMSDEAKKKMSDAKKGKIPTHLVNYWKGRKLSPERREKAIKNLTHRFKKGVTATMKGRKRDDIAGANHPSWKGGVTKNKSYVNWQKNQYHTRLKAASGSHTFGEWELLKKQYAFICPICLKPEPEIKLTEDHIIPISRGGSNYIENIQPLCLNCNMRKHAKLIPKIQITNIR